MTEKEKMIRGGLYRATDPQLVIERARARRLCREFNETVETQESDGRAMLRELFGTMPEHFTIEPRFHCDYGYNIHLGDNFYANFDLVILDVCEVRIGDDFMAAPRVTICAATHPLDAATRASGVEYGAPVQLGDRVWVGAHAVINPGVTLGDDVVVGAGAVVTKSFPDKVVLAGVPARVIREL